MLTVSDTRAANTTRDSWSRPSASAPSGCSAENPANRSTTFGWLGSLSGSQWAPKAHTATTTSHPTASQNATPRWRRRPRAQRGLPGVEPIAGGSRSSDGSSSTPSPTTRSAASSSGCSAMADPRVEQHVQEVDDDVDHDEGDGDDQRAALHHHQVALEDRVDQQPAHAGQREQGLDDHRPADHGGDLETDDRQ